MVTIDVWRGRIGLFHVCRAARRSRSVSQQQEASSLVSVVVLHFLICAILLVIGNVEMNPGPASQLVCNKCLATLPTLGSYSYHQKVHANDFNFSFHCAVCQAQFSSFLSLNSHISKCHRSSRHFEIEKAVIDCTIPCAYCDLMFNSKVTLCYHVKDDHANYQEVHCPMQEECDVKDLFNTRKNFAKHLSQHHKGWRHEIFPTIAPETQSAQEPDGASSSFQGVGVSQEHYDSADDGMDVQEEEAPFYDAQSSISYEECDIYKFISSFYLMLEVDFLIPEIKIDKIADNLSFLSEMTALHMKDVMAKELQAQGIPESTVKSVLCRLLDSNVFYLSHHKGVRGPCFTTSHLRHKSFQETYDFVPAQEEPLGEDTIDEDSYYYVKVRDTLAVLLKDASVQQEIQQSFHRNLYACDSDVLTDYIDGEVLEQRSLPPKRLDLIMFQDGFSATSMLTTVRQKHKIVGTYMTLGNLNPWHRTKVKSMQLVMLILEKHVKQYRQVCFSKLQEELKELEEHGISFLGETIPVYLQFFVGDNLGSHFLGGFVEGFNSTYPCRYCPIKKEEYKANPALLKELRTPIQYDLSCRKVSLKNLPSHKGIKENSVLNKLTKFKVCDPGLPPCIGHDVFHGVMDQDLTSMIAHFVSKKWFTYKLLNRRISKFKYDTMDSKNKPAPVKNDEEKSGKKLGGSAVQNWTLLRLLPFIIEGKIKDNQDPVWRLYLKLKSICEIVCSPALAHSQVDALDNLTASYLSERTILPNHVIPKHHYFRHYAQLTKKCGPLIHLWAMRFEQKHQYFKKVARTSNNFIDLVQTLANKHQLLFAYQTKGVRYEDSFSKCKPYEIRPGLFDDEVSSFINEQNFSSCLRATNDVKKNGLQFSLNNVLILNQSTIDIRVGVIKAILVDGSELYFILREKRAVLDEDLGVYTLPESEAGQMLSINFRDLQYPCIQPIYSFRDKDCFSLKHSYPIRNQDL